MHEKHRPEMYVGGMYVQQRQVWIGEFEASANELYTYAEVDVRTVEEYAVVLDMLHAQQTYMMWWDSVKNLK